MRIRLPSPAAAVPLLFLAGCTGGDTTVSGVQPPGREAKPRTELLKAGAAALQNNGPLAKMDVYLDGFHPMKDDPQRQMEAHHFCHQVNEDFAQCALFDGNTVEANLTGVEYIVSERLFERLPAEERMYWHPHNGEILSGMLVAPFLPNAAEKALMRSKMNSYGKTWHTWHSRRGIELGDRMPLGPAMLAWSFNRDGEALPGLVELRDQALDVDTGLLREQRRDLRALARPQEGVDVLRGAFPAATPIPGVVDKGRTTAPRSDNRR